MFEVNFRESHGVFGVPNEVVDNHLKLCGALSLKVLLVLFRHSKPMSAAQLAEILNQNEGDVRDALNHWVQLGMVNSVDGETKAKVADKPAVKAEAITQEDIEEKTEPVVVVADKKPRKKGKGKVVRMEKFRRMTRRDVNQCAMEDDNVGILIEESQNALGRELFDGESELLVSLYHYYDMQPDILLMLLHFSKSIGEEKPTQYEKVALDWLNRGINTHEKVDGELLSLARKQEVENDMRELLGIPSNMPLELKSRHIEYYDSWKDKKIERGLLQLAYQRTLNAIETFSVDYMNTILTTWESKNVTTLAQADKENYGSQRVDKVAASEESASYDLGRLEEMITHGSVWD